MHPELKKTPEEAIIDKILLLSLFSFASKDSKLESMLKAQKLSFLAAYPLFSRRQKAFSLEFYRHEKGAMASGVYWAIEDFHKLGLIKKDNFLLSNPSSRAKELVDEFWAEVIEGIPANKFICEQLTATAQNYGKKRASQLTDIVYNTRVSVIDSDSISTVKDTPMFYHFTLALDDDECESKIIVPDGWLDTLAIALSVTNHANFLASVESPIIPAPI